MPPESTSHSLQIPTPLTPKPPSRPSNAYSLSADVLIFLSGAAAALLLFYVFSSFILPPTPYLVSSNQFQKPSSSDTPSFYDDPSLSYSLPPSPSVSDWDTKRRLWRNLHPFPPNRILMLTGSQPSPCPNPIGDHLLLRFFKNKVDYSRLHGIDVFYNSALLHPSMPSFWAKLPLLRAAMIAHPEAEWLWWVDSDAAITDMEFQLPLQRYQSYNLVVHGWPNLVYENRSWTALNAGVFLLRNCQWSLDFLARWARLGPQNPDYKHWGEVLRAELPDKLFPDSDDQSALIYLLIKEKDRWGEKIHLENEYYFEGYWVEIVARLQGITQKYLDMEKREPELRRRRSEKVTAEANRKSREDGLPAATTPSGWRRPFITHFTGCQPCSGKHNEIYSGEKCFEGMVRALTFADDQVLRSYGFGHSDLLNDSVVELPFDFPTTV
ncbi:hypothetical protein IEQ34_002872 [Dendrobium chrysotoxum]|uniref:Uncharacterized protein n=1 Tax=Dendrobium chrysotoxum TaxID=161865 RepID=A0AAV7HIX6_DENCH|nr:hypothetical protein IEQ34_002872 [Dendrobium chrysotoxum]